MNMQAQSQRYSSRSQKTLIYKSSSNYRASSTHIRVKIECSLLERFNALSSFVPSEKLNCTGEQGSCSPKTPLYHFHLITWDITINSSKLKFAHTQAGVELKLDTQSFHTKLIYTVNLKTFHLSDWVASLYRYGCLKKMLLS